MIMSSSLSSSSTRGGAAVAAAAAAAAAGVTGVSVGSGKLNGKIAVITGGTSGMALATAKLFISEGAYVFITGRRQEVLDSAVSSLGGAAYVTGVQGDVAKPADLDRLYTAVKLSPVAKGRIDILFASAGVGNLTTPLNDVTEEHFDWMFDVNVRGTVFTVQKALPLLNDGGSIILNGSVASSKGFAGASVYCATKAAVRSLARTWSAELLKSRGIRVNVISPGPIDTPLLDQLPSGVKPAFESQVPLGRLGTSNEIATTALFFASSDSSFISGVELFVDGGLVSH